MLFCMPGIIIWMGKGRYWKSCESKYSAFWLFCHKNSPSQLKSSVPSVSTGAQIT